MAGSSVATRHRRLELVKRDGDAIEATVHADEERRAWVTTREGFVRIVRLIEGGLDVEAHRLASSGVVYADRRLRQIQGGNDAA